MPYELHPACAVRRVPITDTGLYQGCIYAWNAHRNGKSSLENIRHDASKGFFDAE